MEGETPDLSVVVAWQRGEPHPRACLEALVAQENLPRRARLQIVLVDGTASGIQPTELPETLAIEIVACRAGASLPELHAAGIASASGRRVALTETHAAFAHEWALAALAADPEAAAVGGAVEMSEGLPALDRALFYCDYGQFLQPLAAGPSVDQPGCNIVFSRWAVAPAGPPARRTFWKTFTCRALAGNGVRIVADPGLVAYYGRRLPFGRWLRRRWVHGRCFGAMRALEVGLMSRLAYGLAAPVLPLVVTWRVVRRVWPKRRHRRDLTMVLPLCFLASAVWLMGEWVGNWFGPGTACREV